MFNCELICKCLQSLDRRERQRALNDLLEIAASPDNSEELIIKVYDETYLYVLKCYSDKYESCRELATSVVNEFFKHLPKNDYYLRYVISTLVGRIGQKEMVEESEEVRLLLLIQLDFIVAKYQLQDTEKEVDFLLKCYDEIVNILIKELTDKYPSAQRAACACVRTLADATPSFHYRAEAFVKPITPMLHHKHSMNRISAIETLGIVALHIMTNSECVSQIIADISPLLMDPMPLVRMECGKTGCRMLMDLKDRYSFFARILPLILCCLNDETAEIRDMVQKLWLKCGDKYFEENENELNKKELVDEMPTRYPDNIQRPSLGCRAIVQRSLQVIKLVLHEAMDWKEDVRLHSLQLLWQIILHAEVMVAVHVLDMFPALARACADSETKVAKQALKCAELLALLMTFDEWFNSCLKILKETPKIGFLKCFYSMFSAGYDSSSRADSLKLAKILQSPEFSHSLNPESQLYMLKFVSVLISRREGKFTITEAMGNLVVEDIEQEIEECIYQITVKVLALSCNGENENVKEAGREILCKLANDDENAITKLHILYMNRVLATFDCLDAYNDENSEPLLLLHGIVCSFGFHVSYLERLKSLILSVWEHASSNGKVKILNAISIGMLSWHRTIGTDDEASIKLLQDFTKDIISPHLTWKPGMNAECLRAMAVITLCSMAQGAPEEAPIILTHWADILTELVEDNNATTRVYALRSLVHIGPIKLDQLRSVGYATIQRLDDPSSEVRDWAAKAIANIRVIEQNDEAIAAQQSFFVDVLYALFLHFEGPELKLRSTIKSSIIAISRQHKDAFTYALEKVTTIASAKIKEELNEIKTLIAIQ